MSVWYSESYDEIFIADLLHVWGWSSFAKRLVICGNTPRDLVLIGDL